MPRMGPCSRRLNSLRMGGRTLSQSVLTLKRSHSGHLGGTNSLVFMPCRERLASAGEDGTLKIWQISSGDEEHSFICDGVDVDKNPSGWSVSNVAVDVAVRAPAAPAGRTP